MKTMYRKCNVAIIAGQLVIGGAESQLWLWLSNLDQEKFQPVVLTLHPGCGDFWESPIESLDIPLLRVPRYRNRLLRSFYITRKLRPFSPKLIHGWHSHASPYAGIAAKFLNAKSLGSLRSSFQRFNSKKLVATLTLCLTDAILSNSRSTAEQIFAHRRRKDQEIFVVQNGFEKQFANRSVLRQDLSKRFCIPIKDVWIGSLGRLIPSKHFEYLIQMVPYLSESFKDFHVIIIGDGPQKMYLEEMTRSLGVSKHVTFAGEIPDASKLLSALDIFCFTSLVEGLPNAVIEAAVAGVPIVAWRLPFIEEILPDDKMALLVEPKDINGFSERVLSLLRNPNLRIGLGTKGRKHVLEEFNLDSYIYRMSSMYEQLLG